MQEILNKIINEKLNTEEVENKIATIVEKGICKTIEEQFSWNGPLKKELEKRLNEKINEIIGDKFVENTATKINFLLNETLKNSELENFDSALKKIQDILGVEKIPNKKSEIDLDYLFDKYEDYVIKELENIGYGNILDYGEENNYLDEGYVNLDFDVTLTSELLHEKKSYLYDNLSTKMFVLKFETICTQSNQVVEELSFEIYVSNSGSKYQFTAENFYGFNLLTAFELFLMKLKNNGIYLKENSIANYKKETNVDQSYEYEV